MPFTLKLALAVYVLGAPSSGQRTKGAPSPGAVRGSPGSTTQSLHGLRKAKKITLKQVNNIQKLYERHFGAIRLLRASLPWASSLVKARLAMDSEQGGPRTMES